MLPKPPSPAAPALPTPGAQGGGGQDAGTPLPRDARDGSPCPPDTPSLHSAFQKSLAAPTARTSNFGMHRAAWARPACKGAAWQDGRSVVSDEGLSQLPLARLHSLARRAGSGQEHRITLGQLSCSPLPRSGGYEPHAALGMEARQSGDVSELEVLGHHRAAGAQE